MPRPLGSVNKKEPKNRIFRLRVTAREHALLTILAKGTDHSLSEILRSFLENGLQKRSEDIQKLKKKINCGTIYKREERYSSISNSNSNRINKPLSPSDKLDHNLFNPLNSSVVDLSDHDENRVLQIFEDLTSWKAKMHDLAEKNKGQSDLLVNQIKEWK